MKKLVFVGYKQSYEKMEIDALSGCYEKNHIVLPKWKIKCISAVCFFRKELYHSIYGYFIRKEIRRIKNVDVIFSTDTLRDIKAVKKFNIPKVITFRNVFDGSFLPETEQFINYTFDKGDSIKYKFREFNVPIPSLNLISKYNESNDYDFSFVGVDKGRKGVINNLSKVLESYQCNFIVFDKSPKFSYEEYLSELLNSKCVLEIAIDGQSSNTMRYIEALYAGKKIITNNPYLIEHFLYRENNVLLFRTLEELKVMIDDFMAKPFDESVFEQINEYKVNTVYEHILEDVKNMQS
ncbi:lipopolysaccharide biosynthesis protein [Vibrio sinensis]|uniref:Lipopolysaccharide biosynthesis protein n=1 Tax=Vibrio sinensis TaxID=2302434 RepID=A0A3A6QU20_9VIBR|nr:lipopolysaccharide biosynthesis protein [Vibrio sinensis]RJX72467.1 lipopolysaccharide biosynthesis protein [Vibrio sinensis]